MAEFASLPLFTDALLADTGHLSDEEFGRYMRLMVICWRSPQCRIPNDKTWISKRLRLDPLQYDSEVASMIEEFFTSDRNFLTQKRLKKEWKYVFVKRRKNRAAAKSRWNKEKTPCERNAPSPSPSPSPSPTVSKKKKNSILRKPESVCESVWQDFLSHRKAKKAPLTETAIKGIIREADKAGWTLENALIETCASGWQSFKAKYVQTDNYNQKGKENAKSKLARETAELLDEVRSRPDN